MITGATDLNPKMQEQKVGIISQTVWDDCYSIAAICIWIEKCCFIIF
jgi:hypothetical protein